MADMDNESPRQVEALPSEDPKKKMDGCSAGILIGFFMLVCLVFGWSLAFATGKPQLDKLEAAPVVSGELLQEVSEGTAVRLSGALLDDHPIVRPDEGYVVVRHDTRRVRGESSGDHRFYKRDIEESALPALRFLADGVTVQIDPGCFIVDTENPAVDPRSTEFLQIIFQEHGY